MGQAYPTPYCNQPGLTWGPVRGQEGHPTKNSSGCPNLMAHLAAALPFQNRDMKWVFNHKEAGYNQTTPAALIDALRVGQVIKVSHCNNSQ